MSTSPLLYVHSQRLKTDYESMLRLPGPYILWKPLTPVDVGRLVYPTRYELTFCIKAPTADNTVRNTHIVEFDLSALGYPINALPIAKFRTSWLKHPHVYSDGRVCIGALNPTHSLAETTIRVAGFFVYDPVLINNRSIATTSYMNYYLENKGTLPLQQVRLPTIDLVSHAAAKRSFVIKRVGNGGQQ